MFHEGLLYVRLDNDFIVELLYPIEDWDNSPDLPHISLAHCKYGTQPFISSVRTFGGTPEGYRSPNTGTFIRYERATDVQILILMINWNTMNSVSVSGWVNSVAQKCDGLDESEKERLKRLSTLTDTEKMKILTDEMEKLIRQEKHQDTIKICQEILSIDNRSFSGRMNLAIAQIKHAISDLPESDLVREPELGIAREHLKMVIETLQRLPEQTYNELHGDKLIANCYYYIGVAFSHNLIDDAGPLALRNALGYLDESLKYNNNVSVKEYRKKVADYFDSYKRRR